MPLDHTPIDLQALPQAVARAVGPKAPAPAKMMAAKGIAPMGPMDLVTAVYMLALDEDQKIAAAAAETAGKLPDRILAAAFSEAVEPRVIDYFALKVVDRAEVIERILLNPGTADETVVDLASKVGERELEIVANNQQRVLRCPTIVEEMYFNRAARMSTVEKLMELAVRNGLTLKKIPHFDAFAKDILGSGEADAEQDGLDALAKQAEAEEKASAMDNIFSAVLAEGWDEGPVGSLEFDGEQGEGGDAPKTIAEMNVNEKIRLATIGNVFHRAELVRDANRLVCMAVISSPAVNDNEALKYANDRNLRDDVIRYISNKKDWQKNYQMKVALVNNPKTPLAYTLKTLRLLRQADVRALSRSKGVPAAVAKAAKKILRG